MRVEQDKLVIEVISDDGLKIYIYQAMPPYCIFRGSRMWQYETLDEMRKSADKFKEVALALHYLEGGANEDRENGDIR